MKNLISIIVGVATFIGGFILSGKAIDYISHMFSHPDMILLAKILLWVIFLGGIFWISVILGIFIGAIVYHLLPKSKKNVSKYRK